jgi:hypothetical protein
MRRGFRSLNDLAAGECHLHCAVCCHHDVFLGNAAADAPAHRAGAAPRKTGRDASRSTAGARGEQGFEKVQGKSQVRALSHQQREILRARNIASSGTTAMSSTYASVAVRHTSIVTQYLRPSKNAPLSVNALSGF